MSSLPFDLILGEQQKERQERGAVQGLKDPFVAYKVQESNRRRLEELRVRAFREERAKGETPDLDARAEAKWEELARAAGYKNPRNDLAAARNAMSGAENAGVRPTFHETRLEASGKLPPQQETAVRQGKEVPPHRQDSPLEVLFGIPTLIGETINKGLVGSAQHLAENAPKAAQAQGKGGGQEPVVSEVPLYSSLPYLKDNPGSVLKAGWENIKNPDAPGIPEFLLQSINEYRSKVGDQEYLKALDYARNEVGLRESKGEDFWNREQTIQEVADEKILQGFANEHGGALMRHPYMTEFVLSLGLDPTQYINVVGALRKMGLGKALRGAGEAVGDLKPFGETSVGRGFSADYNANKLAKAGAKGEDAAARVSVAKSGSRYEVDQWARSQVDSLKKAEELAPTQGDREILMRALEGDQDALNYITMFPNLQESFEILDGVRINHADARKAFGKGKSYSEAGVLQNPGELENWWPHRERVGGEIELKDEDLLFGDQSTKRPYKTVGLTGSDMSRTGKGLYVQDPFVQMRTELSEFVRGASATHEVQKVNQALKANGFLKQLGKDEAAAGEAEALQKATGLKFRELAPQFREKFTQVVGEPGKSTKFDRVLMPEPMAEHLEELFKVSDKKQLSKLAEGASKLLKGSNALFAKLQTLPFPAFYELNEVGNMMMSTLPMGLSALSPRRYIESIVGSANATGLKAVSNVEVPFQFGRMKMGDVVELAKSAGVIDPRLMEAKEILGTKTKLDTAKGLVSSFGGLEKVAKFQDEGFKLKVFMSFLDGNDPTSVARAAKKTMEFVPNFTALGSVEQKYLSSVIPFYTWARFAGTRVAKQLTQDWRPLLPYLKGYESFSGSQERNAPYTEKGMSDFLRNNGVVAPEKFQTRVQQERAHAAMVAWNQAGRPKPGSDEFIALQAELPVTFAIPIAEALLGDSKNDKDVTRLLYPVMGSLVAYATQGYTGRQMDMVPDTEDVGSKEWQQRFSSTVPGTIWDRYTGRHRKALQAIFTLMDDEEEKFNFIMRLEAMNTLGFAGSSAFNFTQGNEVLDPIAPGVKHRLVSPEETATYGTKKKAEDALEKAKQQKRATSPYR